MSRANWVDSDGKSGRSASDWAIIRLVERHDGLYECDCFPTSLSHSRVLL